MAKNRYFQTTKGFNAEVIVAGAVAYTTQESIADFVANAVEGEIGIYDANLGALLNGGTTLSVPDAPNVNASLTGGTFAAGSYFWKIVAVNGAGTTTGGGEATLTLTGSTSSVQLDWPAVSGATSYRVYRGTSTGAEDHYQTATTNSFLDTGAAGTAAALPGSNTATTTAAVASGTRITILQKRDGLVHQTTPVTYSTSPLSGTRTPYSAAVADQWSITGFPTPAAGQQYVFAIFDMSSGAQPYQAYDYDYTLKSGDTVSTALTALAASINSLTNPVNINFGPIVTASVTGGNTLVLTAINTTTPIRIASRADAQLVTVTHTQQYAQGIGTYDNVAQLEEEGIIYAGVTTNYPAPINALPAEFGTPTRFANKSLGYNIYLINVYESEYSPTPVERHIQRKYQVLAVPSTGTTPEAQVKAVLGL